MKGSSNRVSCYRQNQCCVAISIQNESLRLPQRGPRGLQGARASWWYLGLAANPNIVPPTSGPRPFLANDLYLQTTTGAIWAYNGTLWQLVGNNAGQMGTEGGMWYIETTDPVNGVILVPPQIQGDVWWNTVSNNIWVYDATLEQWIFRQNIKGPPGNDSPRGALFWYTGTTPPVAPIPPPRYSDIWLDTTPANMDMYQNMNTMSPPPNWVFLYSIKGPTGDTGGQGPVGPTGPPNTSAQPNCWAVQFITRTTQFPTIVEADAGFGAIDVGWQQGVVSPTQITPFLSNSPATLSINDDGIFRLSFTGVYLIHYMFQGQPLMANLDVSGILVHYPTQTTDIPGSVRTKGDLPESNVNSFANSVVGYFVAGFQFRLGIRIPEQAGAVYSINGPTVGDNAVVASVSVVYLQYPHS